MLPDADLNKIDVERFWRRDRASLRTCRMNLAAVVDHYNNLRERLSGPDK